MSQAGAGRVQRFAEYFFKAMEWALISGAILFAARTTGRWELFVLGYFAQLVLSIWIADVLAESVWPRHELERRAGGSYFRKAVAVTAALAVMVLVLGAMNYILTIVITAVTG